MKNNSKTFIADSSKLDHLPIELKIAQEAIMLPEVQEMMEKLAKYNLGICMPHMHKKGESFAVLPEGIVQVERDLKVSFSENNNTPTEQMIPVAWRWKGNRPERVADCAAEDDVAGVLHSHGVTAK